jgi:hypothetical protein
MADLGKALALIFLALTKKKSQCVRQGRPIPHLTVKVKDTRTPVAESCAFACQEFGP